MSKNIQIVLVIVIAFCLGAKASDTYADFNVNTLSTHVTNAAGFWENFYTPSSQTSSCSIGQFTDDANYHYVCTGVNHWKRIALNDAAF